MNPEQRKAMNSKSGLSLFQALAGVKPMDEQDKQKLAEIKALHKPVSQNTATTETSYAAHYSKRPNTMTQTNSSSNSTTSPSAPEKTPNKQGLIEPDLPPMYCCGGPTAPYLVSPSQPTGLPEAQASSESD